MNISDEMLIKAVKQAVEEGLVNKQVSVEEYDKIYASIRRILEAALLEWEQ